MECRRSLAMRILFIRLSLCPMTVNDRERCNSSYFAFFLPNLITLQADYLTMVEDRPIVSVKYCLPVPVFHFGQN